MRSTFANVFLIFIALVAGMSATVQGAINNRLNEFVANPMIAALVSFIVGSAALLIYVVATGGQLSSIWTTKNIPWVAWTGGILGAYFVACTIILIPRLGVAMTFSLIVAGQMILTLVVDHYALFGVEQRPVSLARIGGVALIVLGVVLIRRF